MTSNLSARRLVLSGVTGLAAASLLSACKPAGEKKTQFYSVDLTGATYGNDFSLVDHNGQPRTIKDYVGKAVILFFGFLNCPDICPAAMAHWAGVIAKLDAKNKDRVQVLFATVDPARDKPANLKEYVTAFNPNFVGLYGDEDRVQATSKLFRVFVSKHPPDNKGNYAVDHTAASFVFDPKGQIRLYVRPEITAEQALSDLQQVINS